MTATNGTTSPTNGTTPVNCGSGLTCYNGGRCNSTYNCICPDGYQGYNCNLESCKYLHYVNVEVLYTFICCFFSPKVKDAVGTTVLVMMDTVLVHSDTVVNIARTVSGCFCGRYGTFRRKLASWESVSCSVVHSVSRTVSRSAA